MKETFKKIGLVGALVIGLAGCRNTNPVLEGKILKEAFHVTGTLNKLDRYIVVVEIPGDTVVIDNGGREARSNDLKYDVGDSVKIRKNSLSGYRIVN